MLEKGEVKVFIEKLANGKVLVNIEAKHIPEDLKNRLINQFGKNAQILEVIEE